MLRTGDKLPDPHDGWRTRWHHWHHQRRNQHRTDPTGPALTAWLGLVCAGLMQAEPPRYSDPEAGDGPLTTDELADLVDDVVQIAAAEGVAFLRPAQVLGDWTVTVVDSARVVARREHQRLVYAAVWNLRYTAGADGRAKGWVSTEEYGHDATTGLPTFVAKLWENAGSDSAVELGREVTDVADGTHLAELFYEVTGKEARRLVPMVWRWDRGVPAPVHVGNEGMVDHLAALEAIEAKDSLLVRNILAVAESSAQRGLHGWNNTVTPGSSLPTWSPDSNVLSIPTNDLTTHGADGFVQQIRFADDLIQRQRIEAVQNVLLEACGISPQSVGRSVAGRSDSAAAKRADQQMTMTTIAGPARRLNHALDTVIAEVHSLAGGRGEPLDVSITAGLRVTQAELAETVAKLVSAESISVERRVQMLNPNMSDEDLADEVGRIKAENRMGEALELGPDEDEDAIAELEAAIRRG